MSVGPRILFTRFQSADSPKLQPWIGHLGRVLRANGTATSAEPEDQIGLSASVQAEDEIDGAVVWQLVSANNRQLARGSRIHGNFAAAEVHAKAAVATASLLGISFVSEQGRGDYGWIAATAAGPVMVSSRWYFTERDCRHSIEIALHSLARAEVHHGARLSDPTLMGGSREPNRH